MAESSPRAGRPSPASAPTGPTPRPADASAPAAARRRAWLARGSALAAGAVAAPWVRAAPDTGGRRLVVVLLRGAVDGLSVVVPHGEAEYARQRAEIAIAPPGATDGALPLDRLFGLHPALAPVAPMWSAGRLAFVHASGSPDPTRSHFDAQDDLESATPGRRSTPDGWLNRLLVHLDDGPRALGVNVGPSMPRILTGTAQVASLPSATNRADARSPLASPALEATLDRLYVGDAATAPAWAALRESRRALAGDDGAPMDPRIAAGAVPLAGLAQDAARLGRLLRREPALRVACVSVGGWDTHVRQGGARGVLASRLGALAGGLDALVRGLGDRFDETVIVVVSEFGRTVRQNGTLGTDHGHGNAIWLLGGPVAGARVHGDWPGLEAAALHEGRDLAVTTDFRRVLAQVLERHLRLDDAALARVLPDGAGAPARLDAIAG